MPTMTNEMIEKAVELRKSGYTYASIAKTIGVTEKTVSKAIRSAMNGESQQIKRASKAVPDKPEPRDTDIPQIPDDANRRLQAFQAWLDEGRERGWVALLLQVAMDIELKNNP